MNWSKETLVGQWVKKKVKIVVIKERSGEDNVIMVFMENPAIIQKFIKRVKKKVIHRSKIIKYNYLNYLLCKVKIINNIRFEAFWWT